MHRTGYFSLLGAMVALSCDSSTGGGTQAPGTPGGAGASAAGSTAAFAGNGGSATGGDGGSAGTGNGGSAGGVECGATRDAFVGAISGGMACTADADCTEYDAPCLQTEAGNCAGIFYVSRSALSTIQLARSTHDGCVGHACDAGPVCALGGLPPACVQGVCGHHLSRFAGGQRDEMPGPTIEGPLRAGDGGGGRARPRRGQRPGRAGGQRRPEAIFRKTRPRARRRVRPSGPPAAIAPASPDLLGGLVDHDRKQLTEPAFASPRRLVKPAHPFCPFFPVLARFPVPASRGPILIRLSRFPASPKLPVPGIRGTYTCSDSPGLPGAAGGCGSMEAR